VINPEEYTALFIPGNEIAEELGNSRITNMVMLGALLQVMPVIPMDVLKAALKDHMPERNKKYLPLNFEALDAGGKFAAEHMKAAV
ncbi:MAG: 2-oxoacid:acceptor oxidoreductase family protein, partial [Anaerolineales bacterium]